MVGTLRIVNSLNELIEASNLTKENDEIRIKGVPTDIASIDFITFYINDIPLYYSGCGENKQGFETTKLLRCNRTNKEIEIEVDKYIDDYRTAIKDSRFINAHRIHYMK